MKKTIIFFLLILHLGYLSAQSNEQIDNFLNREKADFATTVLLIYQASGVLGDEATEKQAMEYLIESPIGNRYKGRRADFPIEYRHYAHILMNEFDLPGGLMYSVTRLPRYAAKEFDYRRWMPGKPLPGEELTPWEVLTSLSQVLAWMEDNR